ncbi:MAG: AAA domain-containing protein [Methanomassiliicoccales archaeon]|jgi:hypothetical protein
MSGDLFRIEVNQIGEYVQKGSCARRFKLDLNGRRIANKVPFFTRALNPLDPVLKEMGREREDQWERSLLDDGFEFISSREGSGDRISWSDFIEMLASKVVAGKTFFSREVELTGTIGRFDLHGRCDFIVLHWKDGGPRLRIVECKASRKDKTYHRIQLAAYVLMVGELLERDRPVIAGMPLGKDQLEGVVARIDEEDRNEPIMELAPFDLGTEVEDVKHLLSEGGELDRITSADIGSLSYRIDQRCDSCLFSVICLPETARVKGLELLDLDQSSMRVLRANGIKDLCSLSSLDPRSDGALKIRRTPGFSGNLESMVLKARTRMSTLPGEDGHGYEVQRLPGLQIGLLPQYEQKDGRLVRVYMAVDRDYVEDRIVGLSAHVTSSDRRIHTPFMKVGETWAPDPDPKERSLDDRRGVEPGTAVQGIDVVKMKRTPWSKDRAGDTVAEADLIRLFFVELIGAIAKVAGRGSAPLHFYLWKRDEMATLIEGCTRCGGDLLENLTELMGCRQPLEQLIYTIMDEEVRSRFALGWSGGGLVVAASLKWYGERYHWVRNVGGSIVDLSEAFRQGIFDFTSNVALRKDGTWARFGEEGSERHLFEVRSRNSDSLPVPYLHAMWGTLPSPEGPMRYSTRETIKRYTLGGSEPLITAYLKARVQALRWVEERIGPKNREIAKPPFAIASLPDFRLRMGTPSTAAVDFLRMDHHVKFNEWMSGMSLPPLDRVAQGRSVPVREVMTVEENDGHHFEAYLDLERFGETAEGFRDKTSVEKGSWVRLTPYDGDAIEQQKLGDMLKGGRTCIVEDIDLDTGRVRMKVMTFGSDRYRLQSLDPREGIYCDFATLDESPSDMVSGRVDARLTNVPDAPSMRWFDMSSPEIPPLNELGEGVTVRYEALLKGIRFDNLSLGEDQVAAILDGLSSRVQLMQGPPGTGKTTTTAVATLLRTTRQGPGEITLVAANTHMAIDRMIEEIRSKAGPFLDAMKGMGATPAPMGVYSLKDLEKEGGYWRRLNLLRDSERIIVGGTTNEVLKLAQKMDSIEPYASDPERFKMSCLIVDEASMMVMSHFLALASLLHANGTIMLSGDNRQLSPITAHDWENEDRPPFVKYQPFTSAFDAIDSILRNVKTTRSMITRSALDRTYRLPHEVIELISELYRRDDIELKGSRSEVKRELTVTDDPYSFVWQAGGIYLIVHDECESKKTNRFEASIIERIVEAAKGLDGSSVAAMTPHRAQRAILQECLRPYSVQVDIIDTVERLQGGERETVIVSGTQSDPSSISNAADFILDLNRSNVIFSRTKERLIVVCAQTLLDSVPADTEQYMSAYLWKRIRGMCTKEVYSFKLDGHNVKVLVPDFEGVEVTQNGNLLKRSVARTEIAAPLAATVPKRRSVLPPPPRSGIVVDGSNVALHGTDGKNAEPERLKRCYDELIDVYGFDDVYIIIGPGLRHKMPSEAFEELERYFEARSVGLDHKVLLQAPAGAYDDLFTVQFAIYDDMLILTNDRYRDIIEGRPELEFDIRMRLVKYMFPSGSLIVEKWPDYRV